MVNKLWVIPTLICLFLVGALLQVRGERDAALETVRKMELAAAEAKGSQAVVQTQLNAARPERLREVRTILERDRPVDSEPCKAADALILELAQ